MVTESHIDRVPELQVLAMPEILERIFTWLSLDVGIFVEGRSYTLPLTDPGNENDDDAYDPDIKYHGSWGVLARCARVNKLWWMEATPLIWREPHWDLWSHDSATILRRVEPERRQYYANFIEEAQLWSYEPNNNPAADEMFRETKFPRLAKVRIVLPTSGKATHMPRLNAPELRDLEIDPPCDSYPRTYHGFGPDNWDVIFEQIPVCTRLYLGSLAMNDALRDITNVH